MTSEGWRPDWTNGSGLVLMRRHVMRCLKKLLWVVPALILMISGGLRADLPKPEPPEEPAPIAEAEQHYPQPDEPDAAYRQEEHPVTTEQLLNSILDQLKSANRKDMFDESFSAWRFMASTAR